MDRDKLGRFISGNGLASLGWQGLVNKRFDGDVSAARAWLAALGMYAYGRSFYHPTAGYASWVKECFKVHPGTPENFLAEWRRGLDFQLSDVGELRF